MLIPAYCTRFVSSGHKMTMTGAYGNKVEFCYYEVLIYKCPSLHGLWLVHSAVLLQDAYCVLALGIHCFIMEYL